MALFLPTEVFAFIDLDDKIVHVDGTDIQDRGFWSGSIAYNRMDVVQFENGLFLALGSNFNQSPTAIRDENWSSLVRLSSSFTEHTLEETYEIAVAGSILAYEVWGSQARGAFIADADATVFCHHVSWGTGTQNVNAAQMPYAGAYPTVGAALDALFYTTTRVTSFTNDVNVVELGSSVAAVDLAWAYNKAITSQLLAVQSGSVALGAGVRVYTETGTFTSNFTYGLTGTDGQTPATASTSIAFMQKWYWGASSNSAITDSEIIAFSSEFASALGQTRVITAAGQYLYFAFPSSFGTPSFTVNGLPNTAWTLATRSFVNASGYASSYSIWRSDNLLTGTYTLVLS